jgi:hypothetical protein
MREAPRQRNRSHRLVVRIRGEQIVSARRASSWNENAPRGLEMRRSSKYSPSMGSASSTFVVEKVTFAVMSRH